MKINGSFAFILLFLVASFVFIAVLPAFAQTPSTIYGRVYNDANANGIQDAGEAAVAGVTVTLDGINQSVTDVDGYYVFLNVPTSAHIVEVTVPTGYLSTTANSLNLYVNQGTLYGIFFGIIRAGVAYGVAFNDANANGIRDAGEAGLWYCSVTLDGVSQLTPWDGSYLFRNLALGEHAIEVTPSSGSVATTPSTISFNLTETEPEYQVDFGICYVGAVYGLVYEVDTSLGVAGVNVTLARVGKNSTSTTIFSGVYQFDNVLPDTYTIELNVPVGYFATTPTKIAISVTSENIYRVDFGIRRDVVSPVTSNDYDGAWHTQNFNLTLTATDTQTGVSETFYKINGGPTRNVTADGHPRITVEGANNTLEYWSIDNAENEELPHKTLAEIKLDKTAPSGSVAINNGAGYTNSTSVTLNLTANDATSGISEVRFSNDGVWDTEPWEPLTSTKNWILPPGDGVKTVYYQIRDNAGLTSTAYSDTITIDTVAPVGSILINGGDTYTTSTSISLTLTASDDDSGINQVRFSNDGNSWSTWENPTSSKSWTLTSGDGTKTVYYQIKDNAGLTSITYSDTILLDTTIPTGLVIINSGASFTTSTGVTLTLTYSDDGSGVSQVRFSNYGTWDTEAWENPSATKSWTLTSGDGTKTVYYQIEDNAGLLSSTYSDTITFEAPTPAPTTTPTAAPTSAPTSTPKPSSSPTTSPTPTASPSPLPSPTGSATPAPQPVSSGVPVEYIYVTVGSVAAAVAVFAFIMWRNKK